MSSGLFNSSIASLALVYRGKVRDSYRWVMTGCC
jgi:hypothetical protein